jgi:AbrB family looped-hinge helix DNA binding protein
MTIVKCIEHGNSLGISIPAPYRRQLGLMKGDYVELDLKGDTITVRSLNGKQKKLRKGENVSGPGASYHRTPKHF